MVPDPPMTMYASSETPWPWAIGDRRSDARLEAQVCDFQVFGATMLAREAGLDA